MRVLLGILLIGLSLGCGRVMQDTGTPEPVIRSFDLTTQVSLPATQNTTAYVQVYGLKKDRTLSPLSWGRGVLKSKSPSSSMVENYAKNGLKISVSDHTESILTHQNSAWKISANKIKTGFEGYLLAAFIDKDNFALKVLDKESVSAKKAVTVGPVSTYDTFLAVLYLSGSAEFTDIAKFYPATFFNLLTYQPPKNKIEKFSAKDPVFQFDRPLETNLLTILKLASTDKSEAVAYVKTLNDQALPKKAKSFLIQQLK